MAFNFWEWFIGKPVQKKIEPKRSVQQSSAKPKVIQEPKPAIDISEKKETNKIKPEKQPRTDKGNPENEFMKIFRHLTQRHRAWDIWCDFIVMCACAISNSINKSYFEEREARYMKIIAKYDTDEQKLFPKLFAWMVIALDENQEQDFLGKIFMGLNLGDNMKGQIFTPYDVCKMMAKISLGENLAEQVQRKGHITINDPCCGAGATLIASVNEAKRQLEKANLNFQNYILIAAQDIDEIVALMCYIQISLLGVAGFVKVGNSLTDPITYGDTTENYWVTPMYFSDVWAMRRMVNQLDILMKGENQNGSD